MEKQGQKVESELQTSFNKLYDQKVPKLIRDYLAFAGDHPCNAPAPVATRPGRKRRVSSANEPPPIKTAEAKPITPEIKPPPAPGVPESKPSAATSAYTPAIPKLQSEKPATTSESKPAPFGSGLFSGNR